MTYKKDMHTEMTQALKMYGGMFPEDLARHIEKTSELVLCMAYDSKRYRVIDDFITLKGLGENLCIICGEENKKDDNKVISVKVPEVVLSQRWLESGLETGVRGHIRCYRSIDLFFHGTKALKCSDCEYHSIDESAGSVNEKCYMLDLNVSAKKTSLANRTCCNHFQPDINVRRPRYMQDEKKRQAWEKAKLDMKQKTLQGYESLMQILEHERLVSPLKIVQDKII